MAGNSVLTNARSARQQHQASQHEQFFEHRKVPLRHVMTDGPHVHTARIADVADPLVSRSRLSNIAVA
jgi:hypothetical protein